MDGVLEELVDEGGQGGCRVLGDDRPSEDKFKIPGGKNKCDHCSGVSGNSRSRSFPRMEASDSRSRTLGMDFFIPFPFPNFGNVFFHSLPVPEFWEWIFSFPSRSQTLGMEIFHSLPVPELTISKSGIKRENGRL